MISVIETYSFILIDMKTYASALKTFQGILTSVILLFPVILAAQETWPKEITTATSTVIMYQPQPDSMKGDHLYSRAAISITPASGTTPMFGAVWTDVEFLAGIGTSGDAPGGEFADHLDEIAAQERFAAGEADFFDA